MRSVSCFSAYFLLELSKSEKKMTGKKILMLVGDFVEDCINWGLGGDFLISCSPSPQFLIASVVNSNLDLVNHR